MCEQPAGKAFGRVGVQARCMESHLHCSIQWGRQGERIPRQLVYAVRGSRDPVAGACCRSHLQNYHGITLFRAYESPEGRGEGEGGMGQPVQGPWQQRSAGGHPSTSWFIIPRLVSDQFMFSGRKKFFFFFCGPRGKVTASHEESLPLRVPSSGCTAG